MQSDSALCFTLTESLATVEYINVSQNPLSDCVAVHDDRIYRFQVCRITTTLQIYSKPNGILDLCACSLRYCLLNQLLAKTNVF